MGFLNDFFRKRATIVLRLEDKREDRMAYSTVQAVLEDQVREAVTALGLDPEAASAVLMAILEDMAKPAAPDFNPEDLITAMNMDQVGERLKGASRADLEKWFLNEHFFPKGSPRGLSDSTLRSYIRAAVTKQKSVRGNCP